MRNITNDYKDAKVLNLGTQGASGPFLVTQTGVSPDDQLVKTRMFILRPDGYWVDLSAYVCQGKSEVVDEIVFPTMTSVMEAFGRLAGRPRVLDLPIDEAGLKAWIERQHASDALAAAREWAIGYRARHHEPQV